MKKPKSNALTSKPQDEGTLAEAALSKFSTRQYKEAIELYKTLLKQSVVRPEWQQNLAQCYLQRAFEFAAKGMSKEALVLWENYTQNAKPPYQGLDCYIGWILQNNNIAKAKPHLSQLSAQQLDEQYPELACLLGLLIITGKTELQAVLPADSVFLTHTTSALAALAAYRNNDREGVEQALQQLPFRSAFRDLRTLLKAGLLLSESAEQARSLLAKISSTSPYQSVAKLLMAATDSGASLVKQLLAFNQTQIRLIAASKQLNKKQTELLDTLSKQKNNLSDKLLFNLAIQYRDLFDHQSVRYYCLLSVLSTYTAGERDFSKYFGNIEPFEKNRLIALQYDSKQHFYDSEYYWQQCLKLLKSQGIDNNYKIALIMRRNASREESVKQIAAYLIDSLDYDVDDIDSYLGILRCYESKKEYADNFKEWLNKSIEKFPDSIDILNIAIKDSLRTKAFKRATQYALTLLKIDPINTGAKEVLFSSHLAHARKLIKTKKFHLVEKEIQQAEAVVLSKRHQMLTAVMRGFYILLAEDKQQGVLQIANAVQKQNNSLFNHHFFVAMEALLLDAPVATVLKALPPLKKDHVLSWQELEQLMKIISYYDKDDNNQQGALQKTLDKFKTAIKQSIQKITNEDNMLVLCEFFVRIQQFEWLSFCVKHAQRDSNSVVWDYYQLVAKVKNNPSKCTSSDIYHLKAKYILARSQSDERTHTLIDVFIDKYEEAKFGNYYDEEDDEDEDDGLNQLFSHLPQSILQKLQNRVEYIVQHNKQEKVLKDIAKQFFLNDFVSLSGLVMSNINILLAFLMLKAADELGIDTGVTPNKIISSLV